MLFQTPTVETPDFYREATAKYTEETGKAAPPYMESVAPGVLVTHSFNPKYWIEQLGVGRPHDKDYPSFDVELPLREGVVDIEPALARLGIEPYDETRRMNAYGVVDTPEQFLEIFGKILEDDPRTFIATLTQVDREYEPEDDGWRWCKWGPYYGTQASRCEYLYDEPDIDRVYCFHIYEV